MLFLFYYNSISYGDGWVEQEFEKLLQADGNLGERMIEAFRTAFAAGTERVIIIGSDCFDITPEIIELAYQKLNNADVVIGPANDGGYYLIGMKKLYVDLFQEIEWSTASVFKDTVLKVKTAGCTYETLPTLIDIDTEEDLKASAFNLRLLSLT